MPDDLDPARGLEVQDCPDQRCRHSRTGGVAAGVQDPRSRVGGFETQGGVAVVVEVELHAEPSKPGDVQPRLGAQHPYCFFVAVAGPGLEGVSDVRSHRVTGGWLVQHGGDPTLGVVGVAVRERTLGQQHHFRTGFRGKQRGVQSCDSASDDDQPLGGRPFSNARCSHVRLDSASPGEVPDGVCRLA